MYLGTVKLINGVNITAYDSHERIFESIEDKKNEKGFLLINYMYWVPFVKSKKNRNYVKALSHSDFIFPDGVGLLTYIKILHGKKLLNLNGTDLNPVLLDYFSRSGKPINLYGANRKSISICVENLRNKGIKIKYFQDGYSELNWNKIENNSVLFVGMGSPHQEIWVEKNLEIIKDKALIVITVGGYFDFEAGFYKRAPVWIRKLKAEWIYRIIDNPKLQVPKYINNLYFPIYLITDFLELKKRRVKNETTI